MNPQAIAFQGEVQLLRWSETSNQGATVTLQLADPSDLERFKTMTLAKGKQAGQRLAAVMVEVGDDEQPVVQSSGRPSQTRMDAGSPENSMPKTANPSTSQKPGQLCVMACTFCADPEFWIWAEVSNEDEAKEAILDECRVSSRRDLDTNPDAGARFLQHVRSPFLAWREARNKARRAA